MAKRIGPVLAVIGSDVKGFTDGLTKSQKQLQQFAATASIAGARASAAFAATIGAMSAFVIKVGADFELAFANVKKTVEPISAQTFPQLEQSIRETAKTFGIAATEIADLARIGGQLGIAAEDVGDFAKTIAKLSIAAAELDPETAARSLARLAALSGEGTGAIEKMANVVAKLGDSLPTTEDRILDFSTRMASFGSAVGLSSEEILGLSAGFSALVGGTERAATSVERFLGEMASAVAAGGDQLEAFAEIAGMALDSPIKSAEDFAAAFQDKPLEAINLVIGGMEQLGKDGLAPLLNQFDALGIKGVRMLSTFAAGAKGADTLRDALATAAKEAQEQTKLNNELAIQLDTVSRQFDILKQIVIDVGITLFKAFRDEIMFIISALQSLFNVLGTVASFVDSLGSVVQFAIIGVIGLVGAFSGLLLILGLVGGLVAGLSGLVTTATTLMAGMAGSSVAAGAGLATYGVATGTATTATGGFTIALNLARTAFMSFILPVAAAAATFAATFALTRELAGAFRDMEDPVNKAASEMGAFTAVVETVKIAGGTLLGFFKEAAVSTGLFSDTVEDLLPPTEEAAQQFDFFGRRIEETGKKASNAKTLMDPFTLGITKLNEAMIAMREETRIAEDRVRTIAIASALAGETFETLGEATAFLAEHQKQGEEAAKAHREELDRLSESGSIVVDNINDQISGLLEQAAAEERVSEVAKGLNLTVDELNQQMGTNREEFLRLAEAQISSAKAAEEHRKEMEKLRESLRADSVGVAAQNFENFATVVRETFDSNVALTDKGTADMVKKLRELADTAGVELPADLKAFADAVDETVTRMVKVNEIAKEFRTSLAGMSEEAEEINFEGLQQGLIDALAAGEEFSAKVSVEILKQLDEAGDKSGQAFNEKLTDWIAKTRVEALKQAIEIPVAPALPTDINDLLGGIDFGPQETPDFSNLGPEVGGLTEAQLAAGEIALKVREIDEEIKVVNKESSRFNEILRTANAAMQSLGISSESAFGTILSGLASGAAAGGQFNESLLRFQKESIKAGGDFKALFTKEGFSAGVGLASAAVQGAAGIWQATSKGGAKAVFGGAAQGAALGNQIGGPIGAGIGAAVGAGLGLVRNLIKSESEKIAGDIKDIFGVEISEELAKEMEKIQEELDVGRFESRLIKLGDIMAEAGGVIAFGMEQATVATNDLMNAIAMGVIPAEEGIASLGQVFGMMAEETFEAGQLADAAMLQIIQRSRQLGLEVPEIAAFVSEQLAQAAAGVSQIIGKAFEDEDTGEKVFGGIQVASVEDAQAQATIFAAAFFATLDEEGLKAAVDTFGPAFDEMKQKFAEFGEGVDFQGVGRLFEIAEDPKFGPLLDGIQGLKDAMTGLGNAGFLTQETFAAFQQQGQSAFEQLQAMGLEGNEALQQMAPFLQEAINASQTFGFELDENTQAMIAQAEAAGIGFATDPMQQMVDILALVAEQLGVTQEALAGVGVGAQEAASGVNTALGPEGLGPAREGLDGLGMEGRASMDEVANAARSAGDAIGAGVSEGAREAKASTEEAAQAAEMSWKDTTELVQTGFGEMTGGILENYAIVIEQTGMAGTAVSSLGETAMGAATGFDQMAAAARAAAEAARNANSAGGEGSPGPPRGGQFGLTTTVREPTMFVAGEAGEERVTIDPGGGPGAGGGGPSVVVLQIDGKTIGKVLGDLSRTGDVRIHPSAVKDFG